MQAQTNPIPPHLDEAVEDPDQMSALIAHPDWLEACDPERWLPRELKALLFSTDWNVPLRQLDHIAPASSYTFWAPSPEMPMAITGILSRVPTEVIQRIIHHLDFGTLDHLSMTCRYLRAVTARSPTRRFLMSVVPKARALVRLTGLVYWHSMHDFVVELHQLHCRLCGDVANSLYLPTCQRVCINCMIWRKELNLIPIEVCQTMFNFTMNSLRRLPVVRARVRTYNAGAFPSYTTTIRYVVDIQSSFNEAIRVHGNLQGIVGAARMAVPWAFPGIDATAVTMEDVFTHIATTSLEADIPPFTLATHNPAFGVPMEEFTGYASTIYPYLPPPDTNAPVLGFCVGCGENFCFPFALTAHHKRYLGVPEHAFAPPEALNRFLLQRARKARTWDELRQRHLHQCLGAHLLMYENFDQRTPYPPEEE